MNFEKYNKELSNLKIKKIDKKLKTELNHTLEMTAEFDEFFKSDEEKNILFELKETTNLTELEKYEKELNGTKFWN